MTPPSVQPENERSLRVRLDSPVLVSIITATVYLGFLVTRLAMHGFDFSYFVTAGDKFCDAHSVPSNLTVLTNSDGYDGQFYYRLALDPFTSTRTDFGITLDAPAHRQQRILYPLIVWALSLGQAKPVPAVMIAVNYVALCAMAWVAARFVQSAGRHALWGLVFPMWPGFVLSLSRNLTEVLAMCLSLTALLLVRRKRDMTAALFLAFAVLTRETCLLFVVALAVSRIAPPCKNKQQPTHFISGRAVFCVPLAVYVAWQLALLAQWHTVAAVENSGTLGVPLVGFLRSLMPLLPLQTYHQVLWSIQRLLLIALAVGVASAFRSSEAYAHEKLAWLLYTALAVSLAEPAWADEWNSLRLTSEFYVTGAILLVASSSPLRYPLFAAGGLLWAFTLLVRSDICQVAASGFEKWRALVRS